MSGEQKPERVYLVATGEIVDGRETYTRHDALPPMCDFETLYAAPPEQPVDTVRLAATRVGRVYLSGPMTGYAEFNFPTFNAAAAALRAEGWSVVNPADHGLVDGAGWGDYLRHDIAKIAGCESIALLPGWSKSKGAQLEVHIANALEMPIRYLDGAEPAQAQPADLIEMSPEFTDTARSALLWVLWHHQGGSSDVGQPIRFALGMGQHEHLSDHQIREAKRWGALPQSVAAQPAPLRDPLVVIRKRPYKTPCGECHLQAGEVCDICGAAQPAQARDNLRDTIGQALADYMSENASDGVFTIDPFDARNIDAIADAVVAAQLGPAHPAQAPEA